MLLNRVILLALCLALLACGGTPPEEPQAKTAEAAAAPAGPERWEEAIQAFEQADRANPPAKGQIVFVGSSSARRWPLEESFPGLDVLNRGFGGSQISDSLHYADRFLIPLEPRTIVFYAGDNDLAGGKSPQTVAQDYRAFAALIHDRLPQTKIVFIAIKPSIQRWNLVETMREANALIRAQIEADDRAVFVDVDAPMIGADGKPRPELFVEDGLHMTPEGYVLWASLVRPHLE
jgi:lysophospholipase L1-like esterase